MTTTEGTKPKRFDLEQRTERFARDGRAFLKKLPRTTTNIDDGRQLGRSTGSCAANYIEANEALSKKDFVYRIRIARKETKESSLWLRLIDAGTNEGLERERQRLLQEADELRRIFTSIIEKTSGAHAAFRSFDL